MKRRDARKRKPARKKTRKPKRSTKRRKAAPARKRKKPKKKKAVRKMGRPSKRTPAIQKRICQLIAKGNTRRAAAHSCRISTSTLQEWIAEFPDFSERIREADAKAEIAVVNHLWKAARRSFNAAVIWLERRRPAQWGKNAIPEDSDEEKGPLEMGVDGGSDDTVVPLVITPGAGLEDIRKGLGLDVVDQKS